MNYLYSINRFIILITILVFAVSGPVTAQNAKKDSDILVIPLNKPLPEKVRKIGVIKAGNNSTSTHCDYESVIQKAKIKAKKMGGNVIKITKLVSPAFISS